MLDLRAMRVDDTKWLVSKTSHLVGYYKIHSLWDEWGRISVKKLHDFGARKVIVDLKLADTPDTARERAQIVADSGAWGITAHAVGGGDMLRAVEDTGLHVYAVSVLTSLSSLDAEALLNGKSMAEAARSRIAIAIDAGIRAFVCPGTILTGVLKSRIFASEYEPMEFLVPGTRWPGSETHDQRQVVSPAEAIIAGGKHTVRLVVGREVTQAPDPVAALERYSERLERTLEDMRM